jgi:two-component sensor histidine kinase
LFDEHGVMRFVAHRGLSQAYRRAVDGHSPWRPTDVDPEAIFIDSVGQSTLSPELKRTIAQEGIEALAFIPLVSGGRVIGKFMSYYDAQHPFSDHERNLAVTIARQLGFGIERRQAEERRQATERELRQYSDRLKLATQAGKVGLWDWEIEPDRITWTDSLFTIHGLDKADFDATFADWIGHVHPDDRDFVARAVERSVRDDAPYELEMRTLKPNGEVTWLYATAIVSRQDGRAVRMAGAVVDITERKLAENQRDLMVAELSHRVKNTLATVVSIARQSLSRSSSLAEANRSLEGRIQALAQTHSRLAEANWAGVPLETMLRDELAPYIGDEGNVRLSGPHVTFRPKVAVVLGMAFHELATNAAKYGALSVKGGVVSVAWQIEPHSGQLTVTWKESGGPPVEAPGSGGFGRLLLERALASDLGGKVELNFARDGLECVISLALDID